MASGDRRKLPYPRLRHSRVRLHLQVRRTVLYPGSKGMEDRPGVIPRSANDLFMDIQFARDPAGDTRNSSIQSHGALQSFERREAGRSFGQSELTHDLVTVNYSQSAINSSMIVAVSSGPLVALV